MIKHIIYIKLKKISTRKLSNNHVEMFLGDQKPDLHQIAYYANFHGFLGLNLGCSAPLARRDLVGLV